MTQQTSWQPEITDITPFLYNILLTNQALCIVISQREVKRETGDYLLSKVLHKCKMVMRNSQAAKSNRFNGISGATVQSVLLLDFNPSNTNLYDLKWTKETELKKGNLQRADLKFQRKSSARHVSPLCYRGCAARRKTAGQQHPKKFRADISANPDQIWECYSLVKILFS